MPPITPGQQWLIAGVTYDVRTVAEGSVVLVPTTDARRAVRHMTTYALAQVGQRLAGPQQQRGH